MENSIENMHTDVRVLRVGGLCVAVVHDWLRKLILSSYPIRCKTKTNHTWNIARISMNISIMFLSNMTEVITLD